MNFEELINQTRELQRRFDLLNDRQWTIDTYAVELLAETGSLADSIMIQENYRQIRAGQKTINLADDIADILFILVNIADYYSVNLEEAYMEMLRRTNEKLSQREDAQS